jgi:hypothetical protein
VSSAHTIIVAFVVSQSKTPALDPGKVIVRK